MSEAMAEMPLTHPLRAAWEDFMKSYRYDGLRKQAGMGKDFVDGALWGVWLEAYSRATERAAMLHESVNPASDREPNMKHASDCARHNAPAMEVVSCDCTDRPKPYQPVLVSFHDGDAIEYVTEDGPCVYERIDHNLDIVREMPTGKIIGFRLNNWDRHLGDLRKQGGM